MKLRGDFHCLYYARAPLRTFNTLGRVFHHFTTVVMPEDGKSALDRFE